MFYRQRECTRGVVRISHVPMCGPQELYCQITGLGQLLPQLQRLIMTGIGTLTLPGFALEHPPQKAQLQTSPEAAFDRDGRSLITCQGHMASPGPAGVPSGSGQGPDGPLTDIPLAALALGARHGGRSQGNGVSLGSVLREDQGSILGSASGRAASEKENISHNSHPLHDGPTSVKIAGAGGVTVSCSDSVTVTCADGVTVTCADGVTVAVGAEGQSAGVSGDGVRRQRTVHGGEVERVMAKWKGQNGETRHVLNRLAREQPLGRLTELCVVYKAVDPAFLSQVLHAVPGHVFCFSPNWDVLALTCTCSLHLQVCICLVRLCAAV
jgi:hypothetical protein